MIFSENFSGVIDNKNINVSNLENIYVLKINKTEINKISY